jgi:segregation and condensation protein A
MMTPEIKIFQGEQEENYRVQLPVFEGPLDLLLHLIKKNELNIYDIPIALMTHQYLEYLDLMKSLNLNIAGEFLVMAATLIHIKSKMLLPPEDQEEETEEEDPRADLVRRLLEYQQFKHAAEEFSWREEIWRDVFRRENPPTDPAQEEVVLSEVSLFDLMGALQAVLARVPKDKVLEIIPDEVSVRQRMSQMMERLEKVDGLIFEAFFEGEKTRAAVIVTFLALLELIRLQLASVHQIKIFETIWISRVSETKGVVDSEL